MLEDACAENEKDHAHMPAGTDAIDVKVPAEVLKSYAGSYDVKEDTKTVVAEIFAEGDGLYLDYDHQGKQKLDALSETTFSLAGTIFEFIRDGQKGGRPLHASWHFHEFEPHGLWRHATCRSAGVRAAAR